MPEHFKYAYLGEDETLIGVDLQEEETMKCHQEYENEIETRPSNLQEKAKKKKEHIYLLPHSRRKIILKKGELSRYLMKN